MRLYRGNALTPKPVIRIDTGLTFLVILYVDVEDLDVRNRHGYVQGRLGKISSTRSRSLQGKDNGYFMRTSVTLAFAHVTTTGPGMIVLVGGPSPCCTLLVENNWSMLRENTTRYDRLW